MRIALKAVIARVNEDMSCAGLEDSYTTALIAECKGQDPKRICIQAANRLRELAWKFERLSEEEAAFSVQAQRRVNRMRAPSPNATGSATGEEQPKGQP